MLVKIGDLTPVYVHTVIALLHKVLHFMAQLYWQVAEAEEEHEEESD